MSFDRYRDDPLAPGARATRQPPTVPAEHGLVVEEVTTGWVGAVVRVEKSGGMHLVVLEDRRGTTRSFRLGPGFWIDGRPVELVPPPARSTEQGPSRTASGSVAPTATRARVARGSRIWVEGRHDAELVEKIWGDDLRVEGVVVEMLDGVDNLMARLDDFRPEPGRRVGVLVDHLVTGSKESRVVEDVTQRFGRDVLVVGHPYVDVWQAVKPDRVGLDRWPAIDRGTEWKRGILAALGWPNESQRDVAEGWRRILASVSDFRDIDPALLGRVEELIDFVTAPSTAVQSS